MITDHQALVVIIASCVALTGNAFLQVVTLMVLTVVAVLNYIHRQAMGMQ